MVRFIPLIQLLVWATGALCLLSELALDSPNHIISINGGNMDLIQGKRDFYTLLVLTSTVEAHGCEICLLMNRVVERVSRAWYATHGDFSELYFINIDIIDKSNTPLFGQLQLETVPHCWLIPPSTDEFAIDPLQIFRDSHYTFQLPQASFDEQVKLLARLLTELTKKSITIEAEDQMYQFIKAFLLFLIPLLIIKKTGGRYLGFVTKKHGYTVLVLLCTLICIGGYQFTISQGVPFITKNDDGLVFISGGLQYQYGIEVLLSLINYATLATSILVLTYLGQYKINSKSKIKTENFKFFLTMLNNLILFILFSCLTSMFTKKVGDYPYGISKVF